MKLSTSKIKWAVFLLTSAVLYAASRVGKIVGETVERNAAVATLNGGNVEFTWQRLLSENTFSIQFLCATIVTALFYALLIDNKNEN